MRIAVLGAGSWGTAAAALLADNGHDVILRARRHEVAESINRDHRNPDYLTDAILPDSLTATVDLERALAGAEVVVLAVPSPYLRDALIEAYEFVTDDMIFVSLVKGIEKGTLMRMSEVIADVFGEGARARTAVLSGPNHSEEVIRKIPTATVIASENAAVATTLQRAFMTDYFRVYTNDDVKGVELGGAVKNVIAIAVGISDSLGYGDNTRGALITRGLSEMLRLGTRMGARASTFLGLAGIGDLIATATSRHSRNRMAGELIGSGMSLNETIASMKMVAEGIWTSRNLLELAGRYGIEMPITTEVVEILYHGKDPRESVLSLMRRAPKPEDVV
jgi:glycerol-3-phosphate dehydrogenase (NAD(P)+)